MKKLLILLNLISFMFFLFSCRKEIGKNKFPIGLSPNQVVLSWESQSFSLTSNRDYDVDDIIIDNRYSPSGFFFNNMYDSQGSCSIDFEWVHWTHVEGDDYATIVVDENLTGKSRTACLIVTNRDSYDRLSITQRPKE